VPVSQIEGADRVLTSAAAAFVDDLTRRFRPRIDELLARRRAAQERFNRGGRPDLLTDLLDRRVEITGPVDRKMIINALNSGAQVFMADFEDANSPTWANLVSGQANLMDAVRRTISYKNPDTGKRYSLNPTIATLLVRPRGFHLPEPHLVVDRRPAPGMLVDFGLYFFHNVDALRQAGTGPYFYLPKMESHLEARLWNDVFVRAQEALNVPRGTIRATVLIETLPAAFEMDEILFELKEHSAGLKCGRWDYIFSSIKTLRNEPAFVLPDRGQVTMAAPFLRAYTQLLIKTCHRRGAHAMGGMAAQIPIKDDPEANERALEKVRAASCGRCARAMTARGSRIRGSCRWRRRCSTKGCPGPINSIACATTLSPIGPRCWSRRAARARKPACVTTFASGSSTSRRGSAARAPCRSTT
jgi:malate synthase